MNGKHAHFVTFTRSLYRKEMANYRLEDPLVSLENALVPPGLEMDNEDVSFSEQEAFNHRQASVSVNGGRNAYLTTHSASHSVIRYFSRLMKPRQMDFEFAAWQMLYLLIGPRQVYKLVTYQRQTRRQWARDDPAFVIILCGLLLATSVLYSMVYATSYTDFLQLGFSMIFLDFVLVGFVVSTASWLFTNKVLLNKTNGGRVSNEAVEWGYAFDLHCNAFYFLFVWTYVIQFFLLGIVNTRGFLGRFIGNTIYFIGIHGYLYQTYLGYQALPMVSRASLFMYPAGILTVLYVISLFTVNVSSHIMQGYFPKAFDRE